MCQASRERETKAERYRKIERQVDKERQRHTHTHTDKDRKQATQIDKGHTYTNKSKLKHYPQKYYSTVHTPITFHHFLAHNIGKNL